MFRVPRRAAQLVLAGCAFAAPRVATADPLPVDLSWDAPAECPSQADVMAELGRITRVKPGRVVTPIRAQAKIERTSAGKYQLNLRTEREDQTGDTALDAATCPVLKRGVTLVLALALGDGVDVVDDAAPAPEAAPTPAAAPAHAPAAPARTAAATVSKDRAPITGGARSALRLAPWLALASTWGLVGRPAFGGELGLGIGGVHWEANAGASLWPARSALQVSGVGASFFAFVGALGGCERQPFGEWAIAGCAAFELGVIHGRSEGAFQDGSASAPYYAARPALVLTAPLYGAVKLRFGAELGVVIAPPHFALRYFGEVYSVARYVPGVSLGVSFDSGPRARR